MMKIKFSDFRVALVDPSHRVRMVPTRYPTTIPILRAAVKTYHTEGWEFAQKQLDRSLSGYFSRPGPPSGMGQRARQSFESYVAMDTEEGNVGFSIGKEVAVQLGASELVVPIEVGIQVPKGYVGRLILWSDSSRLSQADLETLTAPYLLAMCESLDPERVLGVDVWQIRIRIRLSVTKAVAMARMPRVLSVIAQIERNSHQEG